MKVELKKYNEIIVMSLEGFLDFETTVLFERNYLLETHSKKIIFDFTKLEFVGSCGLMAFIQTMSKFCRYHRPRPRFIGVGQEFLRLMESSGFDFENFYDSLDLAIRSYHYNFDHQKRLGTPLF